MPQSEGMPQGTIIYDPNAGDTISQALFDTRTVARIVKGAPVTLKFNGWKKVVEADATDVQIGNYITEYMSFTKTPKTLDLVTDGSTGT